MAEWNWHVALARNVIDEVGAKNEKDFLLGAILPDAPWMPIEQVSTSGIGAALHCADWSERSLFSVADPVLWSGENENGIRNYDLFCGYLTHLVLDEALNHLWNLLTNKISSDKYTLRIGGKEQVYDEYTAKSFKWSDVATYAKYSFGNQDEFMYINFDEISDDAKNILYDRFGLNPSIVSNMLGNIPYVMQNFLTKSKDTILVDKQIYNSIHCQCVSRCVWLISIIRSL